MINVRNVRMLLLFSMNDVFSTCMNRMGYAFSLMSRSTRFWMIVQTCTRFWMYVQSWEKYFVRIERMLGTKYSLKLLISIMQITLNEWKIFFSETKKQLCELNSLLFSHLPRDILCISFYICYFPTNFRSCWWMIFDFCLTTAVWMFIYWQCVPLPRNVHSERPNGIKNFELRITKPKRYHLNIFTAIKTFSILSLDRFIYYTNPKK